MRNAYIHSYEHLQKLVPEEYLSRWPTTKPSGQRERPVFSKRYELSNHSEHASRA